MLRPVIPARWCVLLAEIAIRGFSQSTVTAPRAFAADSDSVATALMTRVIARRRASLAAISGRSYQSLVKLAAENPAAPPDSARSVLLLTAVHSRIYWEGPDRYQETVDARHRAADGGIGRPPATVDEIAHFERETVDLQEGGDASRIGGRSGGHASRGDREQVHYSLRSPVARDALQQYTYAIVDTFTVEGRHIDRLSVTPIEGDRPSFTGTIDVADSTGDLLAMDLGVNAATAFATITDLRYVELLRDAGGGWWLPYD
ncbi:MAG TPA: hypothetical protein VNG95_02435, partial [Gemmatimonadales bacterium]|nr:hypothetical protein [Gemmatimonadales bacterium]